MARKRYGTATTTVKRKDLKPRRPQTDAQLLASAARSAALWQKKLQRNLPIPPTD